MLGDTLRGDAICPPGAVLGGGYTLFSTDSNQNGKVIPIASFPSDPITWTVIVAASANVQSFILTVYATCA